MTAKKSKCCANHAKLPLTVLLGIALAAAAGFSSFVHDYHKWNTLLNLFCEFFARCRRLDNERFILQKI